MSPKGRLEMWEAINSYARACGGDASTVSARRTDAAALVERALEREVARAVNAVLAEALNSGDGSYKP